MPAPYYLRPVTYASDLVVTRPHLLVIFVGGSNSFTLVVSTSSIISIVIRLAGFNLIVVSSILNAGFNVFISLPIGQLFIAVEDFLKFTAVIKTGGYIECQ